MKTRISLLDNRRLTRNHFLQLLLSLKKIVMENQNKEQLKNSKGHRSGLLDEKFQSADKPKAESPAKAGIANRDEDAADPNLASNETSKGFDRDQEELSLGLDDGDLDTDAPH